MTRPARRPGSAAGGEGAARQGTIEEALDGAVRGTEAAGLLGTTGRLSGQQALNAVKSWMRDGTIVLVQRDDVGGVPCVRGAAILLLDDGEVTVRHMLGRFAGLASTGLSVHAYPHGRARVPTLPSFSYASPLPPVRATPLLTPPQTLVPGATDLKLLLPKLRAAEWSGALVGEHEDSSAAAFVYEGRVAAARATRNGGTLERLDALRALQRIAFDGDAGPLSLVPLEARTAAAVTGFALSRSVAIPEPGAGDTGPGMTGVRLDGSGATYVARGEPYLSVASGSASADVATAFEPVEHGPVPDLHLPDEPPGWETQRYVLTLRGRDALNPMTDLYIRFRTAYGAPGQRLLETLAEGATIEHVASAVETDLDELRPWLKKLEADGLVRAR